MAPRNPAQVHLDGGVRIFFFTLPVPPPSPTGYALACLTQAAPCNRGTAGGRVALWHWRKDGAKPMGGADTNGALWDESDAWGSLPKDNHGGWRQQNDSPDWIRTSDQSINSRPLYR